MRREREDFRETMCGEEGTENRGVSNISQTALLLIVRKAALNYVVAVGGGCNALTEVRWTTLPDIVQCFTVRRTW